MKRWKNKKGVLTVVLVWGWTGREAPGGTGVCFCLDDCGEITRTVRTHFSYMVSYCRTYQKGTEKGKNTHSYVTQFNAFVLT